MMSAHDVADLVSEHGRKFGLVAEQVVQPLCDEHIAGGGRKCVDVCALQYPEAPVTVAAARLAA